MKDRNAQHLPESYEEAKREYDQALEVMEEIQAQLGDRNKLDADGQRISADEYWSWRNRAKLKLRHTTARVRFLKQWMKLNNPQQVNEKEELKKAVCEYATHIDDCEWWDDYPCSCGLDRVLDKYGLDRLERDDETTGEDSEDSGTSRDVLEEAS